MANELIIEGREYVPATLAGKHFGYTKDYLLMLIKQGKIDGKKVGNKWYVHILSADEHFKAAREAREERRREISRERKEELSNSLHVQKKYTHHTALVETFAILILGLAVGAVGYVGSNPQHASINDMSALDFFGDIARTLYISVTPQVATTDVVAHGEEEGFVSGNAVEGMIIARADEFTASDAAAVRESFSDPVIIETDNNRVDTGIVTPIFRDGKKGNEYRFLLVPIETVSGDSVQVVSTTTERMNIRSDEVTTMAE